MEVFPAQDVLSQKATVSSNFQLSNILPKFFYTLDSVTFKLSAIEKRAWVEEGETIWQELFVIFLSSFSWSGA